MVQNENINSIEIKEDNFTFTSKKCEDKRNFDPLSRLEYDEKIKKYFCQLNENEMRERGYGFDKKIRKFIKNSLIKLKNN